MAGKPLTTTVNSDEVNYLVFRYLQESGYVHSAYTFGHESQVIKSDIDGSQIPPGALLSFVQRGVNFVEIEDSIVNGAENGGSNALDGTTSLLEVHKCLASDRIRARNERDGLGSDAMDVDGQEASNTNAVAFPESDVMILQGHSSEVFVCAWNSKSSVLATGSGDSTVRLWPIPSNSTGANSAAAAAASQPIVLNHDVVENVRDKANDVTTLSWNSTGSELASGSYDGKARIWKENGELKHTLKLHKGPLFSVEWNEDSSYLLTGSVDTTTAVWDPKSGQVVKHFKFHTKSTLDIDWRDKKSFASCSSDKTICLCSVDQDTPVRVYHGHHDEINCVKWDPSGTLLASCSDDYSAKIWNPNSSQCVFDLREHTKVVYTLRWSPNTNQRLLLATASFDALIKLWDINTGRCIKTLASHTDPVYSIDFSPNGEYLVSGSFDRSLNIWSVKDGTLVKTYKGNGGIFEVGWNQAGDKVAACYANNCISVLDLRHIGIIAG